MPELSNSFESRLILDELCSQLIGAADAVLVRAWLTGPGDECTICPMRPECPNQIRCLHLASSAGTSTRTDGSFRRFPIGAREVGKVAQDGVPIAISRGLVEAALAESGWLDAHEVRSFIAVPLDSGPRILGALALFSRRESSAHELALLHTIARQAARAIEIASRPGRGAMPAPEPLAETQRSAISRALAASHGRISGAGGAAEVLGLHPNTLISRMVKLGMRRRARRR